MGNRAKSGSGAAREKYAFHRYGKSLIQC
jgi:hypothetical protein